MGSSLSLPQACPQMCNSEQVEELKIWGLGQRLLVEQTANMLGSTGPSHLEAHASFFRLSMKGKFVAFWEKFDIHIINMR